MITSYISTLKQVFNYRGRSTRKDFWVFNSVNFIFAFIWVVLRVYFKFSDLLQTVDFAFVAIFALLFLPTVAVSIRRLHDVSLSGWYLAWNFIPVIGQVLMLFYFLTDSSPAYNDYGEYPKFKLNKF